MGRKCSLQGCKSSSALHSFPRDATRARLWLQAVGLPLTADTSKLFVCGKHFSRESYKNWRMVDFRLAHKRSLRLLSDAVPSLEDFSVSSNESKTGKHTSTQHCLKPDQRSKSTLVNQHKRPLEKSPLASSTPSKRPRREADDSDPSLQPGMTDSNIDDERKFIVYEKNLMELFIKCSNCLGHCEIQCRTEGTFVHVDQICPHCHHHRSWANQPYVQNISAGDLQLAADGFLKVSKPNQNAIIAEALQERDAVLDGDVRADSPGMGKFNSVTMQNVPMSPEFHPPPIGMGPIPAQQPNANLTLKPMGPLGTPSTLFSPPPPPSASTLATPASLQPLQTQPSTPSWAVGHFTPTHISSSFLHPHSALDSSPAPPQPLTPLQPQPEPPMQMHQPTSVPSQQPSTLDDVKPPQVKEQPESVEPKQELMKMEKKKSETNTKPKEQEVSSTAPSHKKIFKPEELRQLLMPTLEALYRQNPESLPFRLEDPALLGIPDPIDLSTIKRKLDTGLYQEPWQYIDDIWLMFNNTWLYNRKTSQVYKHCSKLAEVFDQEIEPIMQVLGYCCGHKYEFSPQMLCCYGKQLCTISRDGTYYSYQNRYHFCEMCFSEIQGDSVTVGDDPVQPQTISKEQFEKKKNDLLDPEPFVECEDCGRKMHQICVLHYDVVSPSGFICDNCLEKSGKSRKENKFSAKRLQKTKLGSYIEERVKKYLKGQNHPEAGEVFVRVVASSDKTVEVKPGMKSRFVDTGEMAESFHYRTKAIFAFEEIDGVDVCFFGMYVQEYGSECPFPNTRRVYISYLDSIHFFKPRMLRTAVYHEILIGYLEYVKKLGYVTGHIWACPPSEGDDYIFHCHPPDQKIPKPKRLQKWYSKMLDKALAESIIHDYKDIFKQATEGRLTSAFELPYFKGDFWPNFLEESIKELGQEEEKRKEENAAEGTQADSKNGKKKNNKKTNKNLTNDLSQKLYATMKKHKEAFFVIHLHAGPVISTLPPIRDPDPLLTCDLMDSRDAFLTLARDKHWEFSSLRRCKWSTMCMLVEIHNQGQDRFKTCNECKHHVKTHWHCTVCKDFNKCNDSKGHEHQMVKWGLGLDDDSNNQSAEANKSPSMALMQSRGMPPNLPSLNTTGGPWLPNSQQLQQPNMPQTSQALTNIPQQAHPKVAGMVQAFPNQPPTPESQGKPGLQSSSLPQQMAMAPHQSQVLQMLPRAQMMQQQQMQLVMPPQQVQPQAPQQQGMQQRGVASSIASEVLQELLHTLKSPSSPQQQQKVLNILKSNPSLMAAFIKQRMAKYQASQPQNLQAMLTGQPGIQNMAAMQTSPMQITVTNG